MTPHDITVSDMYRHPKMPISVPGDADQLCICAGRKRVEAAHSLYVEDGPPVLRSTGDPAVLAQALRSSGCRVGPDPWVRLPPWRRPGSNEETWRRPEGADVTHARQSAQHSPPPWRAFVGAGRKPGMSYT